MDLKQYFTETEGIAVFSSANAKGEVSSAVYSRPHFLEDGCVGFVIRENRTSANLQSNPQASYLYIEKGDGYKGIRLYFKMVDLTSDPEVVDKYQRKASHGEGEGPKRYFGTFEIVEVRKLIGNGMP